MDSPLSEQPADPPAAAIAAELGTVDTPVVQTRRWRLAAFARDRAALVAAVFLLLVFAATLLAPWISPYNPNVASDQLRFAPPSPPAIFSAPTNRAATCSPACCMAGESRCSSALCRW